VRKVKDKNLQVFWGWWWTKSSHPERICDKKL